MAKKNTAADAQSRAAGMLSRFVDGTADRARKTAQELADLKKATAIVNAKDRNQLKLREIVGTKVSDPQYLTGQRGQKPGKRGR